MDPPIEDLSDANVQFVREMTRNDRALRGYLFTLLPCDHAVDEVMQETALALWRKIDQYDAEQPFLPWACRFAYFKALEYRRRKGQDRLNFRPDVLEQVSDAALEIAQGQGDMTHALRACLARLREADRRLLCCRYEEGQRVVDLADQLGRPVKSLYNRLDRLRQTLAECIRLRMREQAS
jgi:RNA polymerase sigma-70 factor (ECF subfamily)